ncbi:MAG: hypothetical protein AUH46_06130 [Gemmatimonadetes bacterium 13_1_40CM_70_15]|nr:MAG: hypothetical protein AUH46_06130 [Gemmatimonadetes bacterium 13_1_40CM_70_15]
MVALAAACAGHRADQSPVPKPTAPLPTAALAGQPVSLFPITLVAAEDSLHWEAQLGDRHATLAKADSVISTLIKARAPEVTWVLPEELRRAARRAVPDPLRSQLRTLAAIAGGRYALVPAALVFRRTVAPGDGRTGPGPTASPSPLATAELSIVMVDVRLGRIDWRTIARGQGDDPWSALTRAVKNLTPGLP